MVYPSRRQNTSKATPFQFPQSEMGNARYGCSELLRQGGPKFGVEWG